LVFLGYDFETRKVQKRVQRGDEVCLEDKGGGNGEQTTKAGENRGTKRHSEALFYPPHRQMYQLQLFNGSDAITQCLVFKLCKGTRLIESLQQG
jgi:hypothetical protein